MRWLDALLLGVVQGATEFFPISSSTHMKIVRMLLGIEAETTMFDLFCHLGTVVALLFYFRKTIADLIARTPRRIGLFVAAVVPLVPIYFLLQPVLKRFSQPELLGFSMIGTALILFLATRAQMKGTKEIDLKDSVWIGSLQGASLIPGISRSAVTIGAALWRGVGAKAAVEFSFLLSLLTVTGGTSLEIVKMKLHAIPMPTPLSSCFIGFAAAATVGCVTVRFAIPLLQRGVLRPFAWYCLIAGVMLTLCL